jgi:plasmid stabilization system protein ParE
MQVIFSDLYRNDLKEILDYTKNNYGSDVVNKFAREIEVAITLIKMNPEAFHLSDNMENVRRKVFTTQQTQILFTYEDDDPHIIFFRFIHTRRKLKV